MTRSLALALALCPAPVCAADPGLEYTPPAAPPAPDPAALVVRLVGLTAGLVALGLGVVWVNRRANRTAAPTGEAGRMTHLGTLALDRRGSVHLVRVDGQTVAVTTDATGVRSMVVLSEDFEAALAGETDAARAA